MKNALLRVINVWEAFFDKPYSFVIMKFDQVCVSVCRSNSLYIEKELRYYHAIFGNTSPNNHIIFKTNYVY